MAGKARSRPAAASSASGLRATIGAYLPDLIFGANDGVITTLAVVAGVVGASLSPSR
jgi:hypothetical protein